MRVFRLFASEIPDAGAAVTLDEENARIVSSVLRLRAGAPVELVDGRGGFAGAEVIRSAPRQVVVRVRDVERAKPPSPELWLIQGIPKGENSSRVVRHAVEFGLGRVTFFEGARTVPKRSRGQGGRWRRVAIEALRQSGNRYLPAVFGPVSLPEAVRSAAGAGLRLRFDDCGARKTLRELAPSVSPPSVCLAVGPEGGWSEDDRALLRGAGFQAATLGPYTLRAETAAMAAMAALRAIYA